MSRSKPSAFLAIALTLVLIVCGWIGTSHEALDGHALNPPVGTWVRTRLGWERAGWQRETHYEPSLHPLTVGSFLGLAAVWMLMVFSPREEE